MKNCYLTLEEFKKKNDGKYPQAWYLADANKFI